jgi:hypothetical protein
LAFALSAATRSGDQVSNYAREQLCPWWIVTFKDPVPPKRVTLDSVGPYDPTGWHPPVSGMVADGATAIRVAQAYLSPLAPGDWAANLQNWSARLEGDQWLVGLSDPRCPSGACVGGGWMIYISVKDGQIKGVYTQQ